MVPPASRKAVAVCNQYTLLITYYISSRLVAILKVIIAVSIPVFDIFYLNVSSNFVNFSFPIFLLFVPEMSTNFYSYRV
jgi:hypothetical protein